ncbi:MAG: glycerate 2-kinase [Solirubrobacteraceae bacterium]|jgi:glycerate kinase|nr:glycerate 2-kinase [Solirubrobacteraceae bacterium]
MTDTGGVSASVRVPEPVLVAPDAFTGTFSAAQVARALGHGLTAGGRPVDLCPIADGGEGTLEVLAEPFGAAVRTMVATDPLGRRIEARLAVGDGVAVVETAAASGLHLVSESERDAFAATSEGTGELIATAAAAGAGTIFVAVGGSATTDGGAGAIRAIERGGGLDGVRLVVLCDVRTRFADAGHVFGPEKGADADTVRRLTSRLHRLARSWPRDPREIAMTGAAGGLAGGLWAVYGAELVAGAAFVLDAVDFDRRMRAAHAVITGEGRLDDQSLVGRPVSEVATRARQAGVPCHAVVASNGLDRFGVRILDLQTVTEAGTIRQLTAAGRRLAGVI